VVPEAELGQTEAGLVPKSPGWFVLNARDAKWSDGHFGAFAPFEGPDARFEQLGMNIAVLQPGQPSSLYHREDTQEDFLLLSGECLLLIEGEERLLRAWDFVHCPAYAEHTFVGAGDGPCVLLGIGARPTSEVVYPAEEVARRHGAGAEETTSKPQEAYAPFERDVDLPYREGWLPGS
jgi:uncharacterized cupin superfamily protein